jgi:ribosomal RNA-processing protein 12
MTDIDAALAKIRPHITSSLAHQKSPAQLLQALESTFEQQETERSSTAYFAALLTTLDSTVQSSRTSGTLALGEGDVLPAELYLLALVLPFVPHPVIRSNLSTILSLTAPLFPSLVPHAPPLRSQLTIYNSVFPVLERSQLESVQGLRQSFASILHLTLDPRPKVRKKAAEVIHDVLASATPPSVRHPYASQVSDFILSTLSDDVSPTKGKKRGNRDGTETGIHILALLGQIVLTLPPPVRGTLMDVNRLTQSFHSHCHPLRPL